jgi:hypothetical protein
MTNKYARFAIEWLNRHYPYLCREVVVGTDAHIHRNPKKKDHTFQLTQVGQQIAKSLAPVEIVTGDGITEQSSKGWDKPYPRPTEGEEQAKDRYDFMDELPEGMR